VRPRPATDADNDFCFRINQVTLREYVEPNCGWETAVQRTYHDKWFAAGRVMIIEDDDGAAIGVLDVTDEGDHLYLSRLAIVPEAQRRGVGTAVGGLIERGRAIRLDVFTNNLGARRFYERLGFTIDPAQEREDHLSMHRPADPGTRPASR
jgi:ribosomal protein S18 acetylase RimI-like enzyme